MSTQDSAQHRDCEGLQKYRHREEQRLTQHFNVYLSISGVTDFGTLNPENLFLSLASNTRP